MWSQLYTLPYIDVQCVIKFCPQRPKSILTFVRDLLYDAHLVKDTEISDKLIEVRLIKKHGNILAGNGYPRQYYHNCT